MRLLLLGCTGFVGKELVPALLNEGHELTIISRKNMNSLKINIPFNKFKFLKIDLSKKQNWGNEKFLSDLKDCDGIINLIGEPIADKKWTKSQKEEIANSRVNSTKYLMERLFNQFEVDYPQTKFRLVRYGNVLYSTGSVLCLWKDKLERG